MAEHRSQRDDFLDLDEDLPTSSAPSVEQLDDQVAQAQERGLQGVGVGHGHLRTSATPKTRTVSFVALVVVVDERESRAMSLSAQPCECPQTS